MASPQTKKGYLRLANELAEAVYRFPFSGQELRVVLWAIRSSYGWARRDTPPTSVRVLAVEVRIPIATAGWALRSLLERGVLLRMQVTGGFRVNKNYEEWLPSRARQLGLLTNMGSKAHGPSDAPAPKLKKDEARRAAARKEFVKPTLADVQAYCAERKSPVDPEKFWHHYESNGWVTGRNPMTNWKSSVCYWERTEYAATKKPSGPPCPICKEPKASETAICCDRCRAYCRRCGKETAQLVVVSTADGGKTLRCKGKCGAANGEAAALARAAIPEATREMDTARTERFMSAHRARQAAKETRK